MLPKGLLKEYSHLISILVRFVDIVMVFAAGWAAYFIRFQKLTLSTDYLVAMMMGVLVTPFIFSFFSIYVSLRGQHFFSHVIRLLEAIIGIAFVLAGLAFFTKTGAQYSRIWFTWWMVLTAMGFVCVRCGIILLLRVMRAHGFNERRVVIIGANELGVKLAKTAQQALWTGFRIVSFLDEQDKLVTFLQSIPVHPMPPALADYLRDKRIDEVWVALSLQDEARVKAIIFELRHLTITIRFALDIFGLDLFNHSLTEVAGIPVLNIRATPMTGVNRLVKAIEDRTLAILALILVSPLCFFITLGIKLTSKGPVLFKQARLGWDGRVITIYKFRTMIVHHEASHTVTQATIRDKRVTWFGRWLRRFSLDELPQLVNVLQGRMSMVGPRPHALPHNELYKDMIHTYMQRHRVKPGITGWAQVNGWRGETDTMLKMEKRVEYDLYYINNWSFAFDLKIMFLTCCYGLINKNAY
ncbi:MAG: undecaprenyl-phosphate glucose phosphotransferase [Gammaproteobacteria bacterium RIFCSPHIGHO2_12_FULL_42_10]|nr:MAG: undecaprenyl-phosphate glucose phosphotransferase [Gammaproteobacteria bacterium RIFCSPHIGHO2_12_FULL_42_10]